MIDSIIDAALNEANWMPVAMVIAAVSAGVLWRGSARQAVSPPLCTLGTLSLFYGVMLGMMTSGHLLAVTLTAARGALEGSPWFLYTLGLALTVPAWWLAATAARLGRESVPSLNRVVGLNSWLGIGLLALGAHNVPIAVPSALNIAYRYHTKRAVGTAILGALALTYLALFVGAVMFMASGQTFEEFQGITSH